MALNFIVVCTGSLSYVRSQPIFRRLCPKVPPYLPHRWLNSTLRRYPCEHLHTKSTRRLEVLENPCESCGIGYCATLLTQIKECSYELRETQLLPMFQVLAFGK